MWKLASESTKQRDDPLDSSGDGRKTTKEERLECPICWESLNFVENVPYVLWCGHTICKYCLLGLQRAVVIKSSALPFHLPFFVTCPWCNLLSLRLVKNGNIKFPSKNYYLLWMVESRSDSDSDNKRVVSSEHKDMRSNDEHFRNGRLHGLVCKSMAFLAVFLAKVSLVVIFLLIASYAIPVSAAVLGVYFFVTFALAVPSVLVLYFAFPTLNWLIREIAA